VSLAKTVPNFRTFKYVSCLVGYPCLGLLVLFWMPFKVDRYTRSIQCNRTFRYVEDIYREAFSAQALRMSTSLWTNGLYMLHQLSNPCKSRSPVQARALCLYAVYGS